MDFGNFLRRERDRLGLTRREVAEKTGLNKQYIYNVETNRKKPSLETVNKLAETYKNPNIIREYMILNGVDVVAVGADVNDNLYDQIVKIIQTNKEAREEWARFAQTFISKYGDRKPSE